MKLVIDRIENEIAVCEQPDRTMISLPLALFPATAKEGDIVIYENQIITPDPAATALAKEEAEKRFWKLTKNR